MPQARKQPDCKERVLFFEQRIRQEKSSIHLSWLLAGAISAVGISSAILAYLFIDEAKMVGTIGSCFIPLLSGFPLKDYLAQKSKISNYEFFRLRYETLHENPKRAKELELEKLEEIYWDLRKKLAGA